MNLAILGAGPGGYVAAIKAAQLGARVTVIEENEVGGACLHWGCIPTKAILSSCEILSRIRHSKAFGIDVKGEIVPNRSKIVERKNKIIGTQVKGIRNLFKSWGITLKEGRGNLSSPDKIAVTSRNGKTEKIATERIIIATGSRPAGLADLPFDGKRIISSDDAVKLEDIPKSLLVVGAGAVGCEFAQIYNELGSEVTILEALPRAVPTEDRDISKVLEKEIKKKKMKLYTGAKAKKIDLRQDGAHVTLPGGEEIVAQKILVAVGRSLNSNGFGADEIGIERGHRKEIVVNEKLETNVTGIYAIGDVIGGLLLAHVASREGIIAARNIMGADEKIDYSAVPYAIFTSPEIASVGLKEYEAEERGIKISTGYFEFRTLAKSHCIGEIEGFVKMISDARSDRLLGVHIIGPHASDLIHEAALAVRKGLTARDLSETIHTHPTLSEALKEAAEDVRKEAVHIPRRVL
ncbi:MAG: dihydrolipoyl dehydrogenase [Nitrospirota bacterium]